MAEAKLYRGPDCRCCTRTGVRIPKGGVGAMGLPGTAAVLVCPQCDLSSIVEDPPEWRYGEPPI